MRNTEDIIKRLLKKGQLEKARDKAEHLDSEVMKKKCFKMILKKDVKIGDWAEAEVVAARLNKNLTPAQVWQIIEVKVKKRDFEDLRETLEFMHDPV